MYAIRKRLFRPLFALWLVAMGATALPAQMISTSNRIGTRAQLLKHLDGLESTWEVMHARADQGANGTHEKEPEPDLPKDELIAQQLNQVLGQLRFPYNAKIKEYILIYTDSKRNNTEAMLGMAALYLPSIEHRLKERNLPTQLAMLPAALSTFNKKAIAHDGRAGLWQLNYQVAIRYGLTCNETVDERRDPYKSTIAAISYLKDLHAMFNDWPLSLAAYTAGPAGINRARNRAGSKAKFQEVYPFLPAKDREDLWAFAAAAYVINHANAMGIAALPMQAMPHLDHIKLKAPLKFAHVSKVLGIPEAELRQMNPVCRTEMIPGIGPVQLCLPQGYGARFSELKDSIYNVQARQEAIVEETRPAPTSPESPEKVKPTPKPKPPYSPPADYSKLQYTIKSGDNLGAIARWHELPLSELKAQNNLTSDRINAEDKLVIYVPKSAAARLAKINSMSFDEKQASVGVKPIPSKEKPKLNAKKKPVKKSSGHTIYTVKSGDNLWAISQKYPGVSADDIMEYNGIGEALQPGMKLKIPTQKQ